MAKTSGERFTFFNGNKQTNFCGENNNNNNNHNYNKIVESDWLSTALISALIGQFNNRTPATRSSDFVNHSYDYGPNWTPLSPVTITNNNNNDKKQ